MIDRETVNSIVSKYESDKHSKGITTWTQLVSMLFCHLGKAGSLREISNGLRSATGNLNHLGVSRPPCKSSLCYQNGHRDWQVFRDIYFGLLDKLEGGAE